MKYKWETKLSSEITVWEPFKEYLKQLFHCSYKKSCPTPTKCGLTVNRGEKDRRHYLLANHRMVAATPTSALETQPGHCPAESHIANHTFKASLKSFWRSPALNYTVLHRSASDFLSHSVIQQNLPLLLAINFGLAYLNQTADLDIWKKSMESYRKKNETCQHHIVMHGEFQISFRDRHVTMHPTFPYSLLSLLLQAVQEQFIFWNKGYMQTNY